MTTEAPIMNDAHQPPGISQHDPQPPQRPGNEPVRHLQRDQLVSETSRPLPRAALSAPATAALWALRIFAILVSLMVIYTFIDQLR